MRPFAYERASDLTSAIATAGAADRPSLEAPIHFLAGGTTLLDLMKLDVMTPEVVVDINPLSPSLSA